MDNIISVLAIVGFYIMRCVLSVFFFSIKGEKVQTLIKSTLFEIEFISISQKRSLNIQNPCRVYYD